MEKVKVTKEQEQAIKQAIELHGEDYVVDSHCLKQKNGLRWNLGLDALNDFEMWQLAKAIYIGHEIEPEFKEKEWMIWKSRTVQIVWINESKRMCCISLPKRKEKAVSIDSIERHATPEEIKQEKERRFWAKHGREVWELKQGDVLYRKDDDFLVIVDGIHTSPNDEKTVIYKGGDWEYFKNVIDEFKVICFAENRLDLSN